MSIRHKARSSAVQVLASVTWRNTVLTDDVQKTIENVKEEFFPQTRENEFFESLIFGVIKNRTELQFIFSKAILNFDRDYLIDECIELGIPMGAIKNMEEVFDSPIAKNMILEEKVGNQITKRVKSIAFDIVTTKS